MLKCSYYLDAFNEWLKELKVFLFISELHSPVRLMIQFILPTELLSEAICKLQTLGGYQYFDLHSVTAEIIVPPPTQTLYSFSVSY